MKKDDDKRKLSRDEALLWERVASTTRPFSGKKVDIPEQSREEEPAPVIKKPKIKEEQPPQVRKKAPLPQLICGELHGLDKNNAERFKKGMVKIEARLDLHGFKQDEAFAALEDFIERCHKQGKRCVLVITGKGARGDGKVGVLFENVPKWLNAPLLRPLIIAFTHAQNRDGGEGALYVLLKRMRQVKE